MDARWPHFSDKWLDILCHHGNRIGVNATCEENACCMHRCRTNSCKPHHRHISDECMRWWGDAKGPVVTTLANTDIAKQTKRDMNTGMYLVSSLRDPPTSTYPEYNPNRETTYETILKQVYGTRIPRRN